MLDDCLKARGNCNNCDRKNMCFPQKEKKQKTGHWITREIEDTMRWKECSECHSEYPNMNGLKYCPNCGVKMEESEGEKQ